MTWSVSLVITDPTGKKVDSRELAWATEEPLAMAWGEMFRRVIVEKMTEEWAAPYTLSGYTISKSNV